MIALLLAASLALQAADSALVVGPVYRNRAAGVELPRPFDDWVFAPATERGTTTVIFHPRLSPLSDNLWGVLVVTPWGSPPPLDQLAERRVRDTWRAAFGASFQLRSRDTVAVAGLAALRLRLGGLIDQAAVDVDEYLLARGNDLVLIQLRFPRGVERDSIESGYRRALAGLRLDLDQAAPPASAPAPFAPRVQEGQVTFEMPAGLRAVSSGSLTAEAVAGDRRTMRYRPLVEAAPLLYAVGRFNVEERRAGRLLLNVWRNSDRAVSAARAGDSVLALLVRGWSSYWNAFGPVPLAELTVVETDWPFTRGAPGIVYLGADHNDYVLLRELARTWWGGFSRVVPPLPGYAAELVHDLLPAWSPRSAGVELPDRDSLARQLERIRAGVDGGRFREALRTLAADPSRPGAADDFLLALGPAGALLRETLRR